MCFPTESSISTELIMGGGPGGQCPYGRGTVEPSTLMLRNHTRRLLFCQTQLWMLAWPKYLRQASVSAALANRI